MRQCAGGIGIEGFVEPYTVVFDSPVHAEAAAEQAKFEQSSYRWSNMPHIASCTLVQNTRPVPDAREFCSQQNIKSTINLSRQKRATINLQVQEKIHTILLIDLHKRKKDKPSKTSLLDLVTWGNQGDCSDEEHAGAAKLLTVSQSS